MTRRLFFALWPDPELRQAIAACRKRLGPISRRQVPDHNLHLTLLFVGNVDPERLPDLIETANGLRATAFEQRLDRFGHFPRAGLVWLGGPAGPQGQALAAGLAERVSGLGLGVDDRPWRPHVTLFRRVSRRPELPEIKPLRWSVDHYVLIESIPGRPYQPLARWPLA